MVETWGMIDYLNILPIACELKQRAQIALCPTPAVLNALFAAGHVSYAPCSSICLQDGNHLLAPVGIAADGPVQSVYLAVHRQFDPERARIRFTAASATSVVLAKLLMNHWQWRWQIEERDPDIELLIGDEALQKRSQFSEVLDLGEEWTDWTGLPFVFAAWQCKAPNLSAAKFLSEAACKAEVGMRHDPEQYLSAIKRQCSVPKEVIINYWQAITYQLGESHLQGLELFLTRAKELRSASVPVAVPPGPEILH